MLICQAPRPPSNARPIKSSRPAALTSKIPHKAPTKKLKRESKHATLLSRIQKSSSKTKPLKRRRPGKKLVTNLAGLADALPEVTGNEGNKGDGEAEGGMKIKHKSLKSRPGAGKRKEKLVGMEMERFGRNLAELTAGRTNVVDGDQQGVMGTESREAGAVGSGSRERWVAIRGFIAQTMERRGEGTEKGSVGKI